MPHSLSYQEISFTKVLFSAMPALMSTIDENLQPGKSVLTTSSSVWDGMPFIGPAAASLMAATISSMDASFSSLQVRSTTDTSGVGTRKAMPVSLPFRDGMTFSDAQRPARQSFPPRDGPSTVSWFAVIAWTVVIRPSTMPNLSWIALARGARQFVVHDALLATVTSEVYGVWFTPITNIGTSSFGGAEMITFLQLPPMWSPALAFSVKTPVDSQT